MATLSAVTLRAVGDIEVRIAAFAREHIRRRLREITQEIGSDRGARRRLADELDTSPANITHWAGSQPKKWISPQFGRQVAKVLCGMAFGDFEAAAIEWWDRRVVPQFPPLYLQALGILAVRVRGGDFVDSAASVLATHVGDGDPDAEKLAKAIEALQSGGEPDPDGLGHDPVTGRNALRKPKKRRSGS